MKRADELKILAMCYWRFNRGCPIVAMEYEYGDADVLAVTKDGVVIETEVKVSIRDLKRDGAKSKHRAMERDTPFTRAHYFFFAVPEELKAKAEAVIAEKFGYAGLLVVKPIDSSENPSYNVPVYVAKEAHQFGLKPKLTQKQMMDVVKHMSTSLCRVGVELLMVKREV